MPPPPMSPAPGALPPKKTNWWLIGCGGCLGLIVVIRTFLSFSLETEIEGVVPWRRAMTGGAGTIRRATASALESKKLP